MLRQSAWLAEPQLALVAYVLVLGVVPLLVVPQVRVVHEAQRAMGALQRLEVGVPAHVIGQAAQAREGLLALVTLERLVLRVHHLVPDQMADAGETGRAGLVGAQVRPDPQVSPQMRSQAGAPREPLVAVLALEGAFARVAPQVSFQLAGLGGGVRAGLAFVRLVIEVDVHVLFQQARPLEAFVADVALQ